MQILIISKLILAYVHYTFVPNLYLRYMQSIKNFLLNQRDELSTPTMDYLQKIKSSY